MKLSLNLDMCLIVIEVKDFYIWVFYSEQFCGILKVFHMSLSNDGLVAFHYRSYGTFFLHSKGPINLCEGLTHYRNYRAAFCYKKMTKYYSLT